MGQMLAREKWQIKTIAVLERVFEERQRQVLVYGHNEDLEDGTGPDVGWCDPVVDVAGGAGPVPAEEVQEIFRDNYNGFADRTGKPTWMHLVREEIAEAFELSGDDPAFVEEILQVAALCVSWAEKKVDARGNVLTSSPAREA